MGRTGRALAGALVVMALGAPPADAGFLPAEVLAPDGRSPVTATGDDGTISVAWVEDAGGHDVVKLATRDATGRRAAPVTVSPPGVRAYGPSVAVAPDGHVVVAFVVDRPSEDELHLARGTAGGQLAPSVPVSATSLGAASSAVAVLDDGTAVLAWQTASSPRAVLALTQSPSGSSTPARQLSAAGRTASLPSLDAAGATALVAWSESDGGVRAARLADGELVRLPGSPDPGLVAGVRVAAAADGTGTLLWQRGLGEPAVAVHGTTIDAAGVFGASVRLSAGGPGAGMLDLDAAGDGRATAVWEVPRPQGGGFVLETASRTAGGGFGPTTTYAADGAVPDIAVARDGSAVLLHRTFVDEDVTLVAAVRGPSGDFGAPRRLTAAGEEVSLGAASAGGRTGAVVWTPMGARGVRAAFVDRVAPQVHLAAVAGRAGEPSRFDATATDASCPCTVTWDLGDGRSAAGPGVTHVYAAAGTYEVTAVAADAAGNEGRATTRVVVAPAASEAERPAEADPQRPGQGEQPPPASGPEDPPAVVPASKLPPPAQAEGPVQAGGAHPAARLAADGLPARTTAEALVRGLRPAVTGMRPRSAATFVLRAGGRVLVRRRATADARGTVRAVLRLTRARARAARGGRLVLRVSGTDAAGRPVVVTRTVRVGR